MALSTGARLGAYEIVAAIGSGGMGACGHGERAKRVELSRRGGGAPRNFLKLTALALPGDPRWR
jgi:hypothetical protein